MTRYLSLQILIIEKNSKEFLTPAVQTIIIQVYDNL